MTEEDGDEPTQHCRVDEQVNLFAALEASGIEHLEVDAKRAVVIYRTAILMCIVTEGQAIAAQNFDVELWKSPLENPTRDPDDLLTAFVDELLATTDTTRL